MVKALLDTNIVIYVIKNRPREVAEVFNTNAGTMCISSVTLAELWYGVEKSTSVKKNREALEDFISRLEVLEFSAKAASHYGEIRAELEKNGNVIGANDLLISAHARSESLVLVTNNEKEFNRVAGLRVDNWL